MTIPKRTRNKCEASHLQEPSARIRKPLALEQRGRFWQSVGEALRAQARAKAGGKP